MRTAGLRLSAFEDAVGTPYDASLNGRSVAEADPTARGPIAAMWALDDADRETVR